MVAISREDWAEWLSGEPGGRSWDARAVRGRWADLAAFIAAARTDIPWLLERADALAAIIETAKWVPMAAEDDDDPAEFLVIADPAAAREALDEYRRG